MKKSSIQNWSWSLRFLAFESEPESRIWDAIHILLDGDKAGSKNWNHGFGLESKWNIKKCFTGIDTGFAKSVGHVRHV